MYAARAAKDENNFDRNYNESAGAVFTNAAVESFIKRTKSTYDCIGARAARLKLYNPDEN